MAGQPPISNAGEDMSRATSKISRPAQITRSPRLFVSQSPSETALTDDQAPSTSVRLAVAVELTRAPPGALDRYVEIDGSDTALKVLREAQGEGGLGFQ